MILFFQFPVTDRRLFVSNAARLALPLWPSPQPYREFIRSFGVVKPRLKGGFPGWIGENAICDAWSTFQFLPKPTNKHAHLPRINCIQKHFFADGVALGKFEVIFITRPKYVNFISTKAFSALLNYIINLPITVQGFNKAPIETRFINAAKSLASLYFFSSTPTENLERLKNEIWVFPEAPLLIVELGADENPSFSQSTRIVPISTCPSIELRHQWYKLPDGVFRVWFIKYKSQDKNTLSLGRNLRIYLMRIHAEQESFRRVLKLIDTQKIDLTEETEEFQALQRYINETLRRINQLQKSIRKEGADPEAVEHIVCAAINTINPGEIESLLQKLKSVRIRPQVFNKLLSYTDMLREEFLFPLKDYRSHINELETLIRLFRPEIPSTNIQALLKLIEKFIEEPRMSVETQKDSLDAVIVPTLKALAGYSLEIGNSVVSFGKDNQLGDVNINDIAGGNITKITININNH